MICRATPVFPCGTNPINRMHFIPSSAFLSQSICAPEIFSSTAAADAEADTLRMLTGMLTSDILLQHRTLTRTRVATSLEQKNLKSIVKYSPAWRRTISTGHACVLQSRWSDWTLYPRSSLCSVTGHSNVNSCLFYCSEQLRDRLNSACSAQSSRSATRAQRLSVRGSPQTERSRKTRRTPTFSHTDSVSQSKKESGILPLKNNTKKKNN